MNTSIVLVFIGLFQIIYTFSSVNKWGRLIIGLISFCVGYTPLHIQLQVGLRKVYERRIGVLRPMFFFFFEEFVSSANKDSYLVVSLGGGVLSYFFEEIQVIYNNWLIAIENAQNSLHKLLYFIHFIAEGSMSFFSFFIYLIPFTFFNLTVPCDPFSGEFKSKGSAGVAVEYLCFEGSDNNLTLLTGDPIRCWRFEIRNSIITIDVTGNPNNYMVVVKHWHNSKKVCYSILKKEVHVSSVIVSQIVSIFDYLERNDTYMVDNSKENYNCDNIGVRHSHCLSVKRILKNVMLGREAKIKSFTGLVYFSGVAEILGGLDLEFLEALNTEYFGTFNHYYHTLSLNKNIFYRKAPKSSSNYKWKRYLSDVSEYVNGKVGFKALRNYTKYKPSSIMQRLKNDLMIKSGGNGLVDLTLGPLKEFEKNSTLFINKDLDFDSLYQSIFDIKINKDVISLKINCVNKGDDIGDFIKLNDDYLFISLDETCPLPSKYATLFLSEIKNFDFKILNPKLCARLTQMCSNVELGERGGLYDFFCRNVKRNVSNYCKRYIKQGGILKPKIESYDFIFYDHKTGFKMTLNREEKMRLIDIFSHYKLKENDSEAPIVNVNLDIFSEDTIKKISTPAKCNHLERSKKMLMNPPLLSSIRKSKILEKRNNDDGWVKVYCKNKFLSRYVTRINNSNNHDLNTCRYHTIIHKNPYAPLKIEEDIDLFDRSGEEWNYISSVKSLILKNEIYNLRIQKRADMKRGGAVEGGAKPLPKFNKVGRSKLGNLKESKVGTFGGSHSKSISSNSDNTTLQNIVSKLVNSLKDVSEDILKSTKNIVDIKLVKDESQLSELLSNSLGIGNLNDSLLKKYEDELLGNLSRYKSVGIHNIIFLEFKNFLEAIHSDCSKEEESAKRDSKINKFKGSSGGVKYQINLKPFYIMSKLLNYNIGFRSFKLLFKSLCYIWGFRSDSNENQMRVNKIKRSMPKPKTIVEPNDIFRVFKKDVTLNENEFVEVLSAVTNSIDKNNNLILTRGFFIKNLLSNLKLDSSIDDRQRLKYKKVFLKMNNKNQFLHRFKKEIHQN